MRQQAEILMDADLARFLADDSELDVHVHGLTSVGDTQSIRLALPDPVTVIIVVAALADIADKLVKVAAKIKEWMRRRGTESTRIVVRGEEDDAMFAITAEMSDEELGGLLHRGVYDEPPFASL